MVAIEGGWLDRLRATRLYRYVLPEESFESLHDYGAHVSRQAVVPLGVEPLPDLLGLFPAAGVELRICRSLTPLAHAVVASTLHFSLIRMRNAEGWGG